MAAGNQCKRDFGIDRRSWRAFEFQPAKSQFSSDWEHYQSDSRRLVSLRQFDLAGTILWSDGRLRKHANFISYTRKHRPVDSEREMCAKQYIALELGHVYIARSGAADTRTTASRDSRDELPLAREASELFREARRRRLPRPTFGPGSSVDPTWRADDDARPPWIFRDSVIRSECFRFLYFFFFFVHSPEKGLARVIICFVFVMRSLSVFNTLIG